MNALEVQREDDVSALPAVTHVDATIAIVAAELAAACAKLRTDGRGAARSLIGGETPTSDVRKSMAKASCNGFEASRRSRLVALAPEGLHDEGVRRRSPWRP